MSEIHISIKCSGSGFPSPEELTLRHALEDAIAERGVGDVVDSGGGEGVMDVFVEVDDVSAAKPHIEAIVGELGLAGKTEVHAEP